MAALIESQRILSSIGYIGNFLNSGVRVGDIYQMDDRQFVLLANIQDLATTLTLDASKLSIGTKSNLSYARESSVEVKFKGDANAPGLAKGEVELNFKKNKSAFVSLKEATITEVKMELIREALKQVWIEKKYKRNGRHVLISQTVAAESGTLIFSQERNNKVILKATADENVTSVAKLGSGAFEFVSNSKATLETISITPFVAMFKALYLKANGNFELLG